MNMSGYWIYSIKIDICYSSILAENV